MILLHITTESKELAEEISDYLVSENLVVDTLMHRTKRTRTGSGGKLIKEGQYLILAKTRALLFDKIDQLLTTRYENKIPNIYSVPIVNMDWSQASHLKETVKVSDEDS